MSNMTSESDDMIMPRDCINSAGIDEVNMVGNGALKKGPWTSAEDAILVDYVNKHGEGNWNAVQKHSGLYRCGKSCRLRWANHLRPDLKKGAFTPEEERKIIELHAKMGNKWARMAVELPGRTDNEIKNFWNTRTKRRQRAGLPIYPPDISLQTLTDNTQTQNMVTFDSSHAEILPDNAFQLPAIEFKKLGLNHDLYPPNCFDLSGVNFVDAPLLPNGVCNNNSFLFPMLKRVRRCPVFDYGPGRDDCYPRVDVEHQHMNQSGSHAFYNGNTSSSSGPWAQERELPSLQYSTQLGSCNAASPLPSLESFETLTQHSNFIGQTKSNRESGLLEAVLLQSQNLKTSNNASIFPPDATTDSSSQHHDHDDADDDWDSMSPLGHSAASVFSEYIPHLGESPLDEHQSLEAISVKQEADEYGGKQSDKVDEKPTQINFSRPDYLLDSNYCSSNWYGLGSNPYHSNYDHSDPVRALLDEDLSIDSNKHALDSSFYGSTSKWDDISEICRNR